MLSNFDAFARARSANFYHVVGVYAHKWPINMLADVVEHLSSSGRPATCAWCPMWTTRCFKGYEIATTCPECTVRCIIPSLLVRNGRFWPLFMCSPICLRKESQRRSCTNVVKWTGSYAGSLLVGGSVIGRLSVVANLECMKSHYLTSGIWNVGVSGFVVDVPTSAFVLNLNNESPWQYWISFSYWISKSNFNKRRHERIGRPDGFDTSSNQCNELWYVKTVKRSHAK